MATPVLPIEPSTVASVSDPNSISSLIKRVEEQNKQAKSDTKYDTKSGIYESFVDSGLGLPTKDKAMSIVTSFVIAAGILLVIGSILPKTRK